MATCYHKGTRKLVRKLVLTHLRQNSSLSLGFWVPPQLICLFCLSLNSKLVFVWGHKDHLVSVRSGKRFLLLVLVLLSAHESGREAAWVILTPGLNQVMQDWSSGLRFYGEKLGWRVISIKNMTVNEVTQGEHVSEGEIECLLCMKHGLPSSALQPQTHCHVMWRQQYVVGPPSPPQFLDCNYSCFTSKAIADRVNGIRRSGDHCQVTFNLNFGGERKTGCWNLIYFFCFVFW